MNLRAALAAWTKSSHESLERLMALEGEPSAQRYAWYLLTMHAVVAAAEREIAFDRRLEALGLGLTGRCKLPWLAADLRALDLEPPCPEWAPSIPPDVPGRVGWAYVLEGSTRTVREREACAAGATQAFEAIGATFRRVSVAGADARLDRRLRGGLAA